MKVRKTIYHGNLRSPDSITVKVGGFEKIFPLIRYTKIEIGDWIREIWKYELFPQPAYIYYNIDWDNDDILYCKYELIERSGS